MKNSKKLFLALIASAGISYLSAQQPWFDPTNSYQTSFPIYRDAAVTIGRMNTSPNLPSPQLEIYGLPLGSSLGDKSLLTREYANVGLNWEVAKHSWLYRKSAGLGTSDAVIHDGITWNNLSTNPATATGLNPGTDTKTWWQRTPSNGIQAWGDRSDTYLTLFPASSGNDVRLGIGKNADCNAGANLEIESNIPLTSNTGVNSKLLTRISGDCNGGNKLRHNSWIVRTGTGANWLDVSLHDGISIDVSFTNPRVDTKTWWERDPNNDIQKWGTAANTYMTLKQGKLYIGTQKVITSNSHSQAIVQVNGEIACKELVVLDATQWADYVFNENYKLRPLNEVESFYKCNRHLPEVPSEAEVKENGINTAQMDATLLKKIEELTIYLVELNKEVQLLKEENKTLKKTN
jgi:hypothetical protein